MFLRTFLKTMNVPFCAPCELRWMLKKKDAKNESSTPARQNVLKNLETF